MNAVQENVGSAARLSDFVNTLALDPRKLAEYRRDPHAALAASALTPDERAAVLSGNEAQLYHAIRGWPGGPMAAAVAIVAVFVIVENLSCK